MRRTIHLVRPSHVPYEDPICLVCGEKAPAGRNIPHHLIHRMPARTIDPCAWNSIYHDNDDYRRCIDNPDQRDRPPARFPPPTDEGFYWAEWRIAAPGSFEADQAFEDDPPDPPGQCRIVYVYPRLSDPEDTSLVADVPGIRVPQDLDSFVWRSGKLPRP